jgi:hypothetical protein
MAWTSRKRRKRYRARLLAGSGGDRQEPLNINGGQGFHSAIDWFEASLSDLRLLRTAIRHDWTRNISGRGKRRILKSVFALLNWPEAGVRKHVSVGWVFIEADMANLRLEEELERYLPKNPTCRIGAMSADQTL